MNNLKLNAHKQSMSDYEKNNNEATFNNIEKRRRSSRISDKLVRMGSPSDDPANCASNKKRKSQKTCLVN